MVTLDQPKSLRFHLDGRDGATGTVYEIPWQDGPVKEVGVNGIQAEAVLEQVADYLRSFLPPAENGEPMTYGQQCTDAAVTSIILAVYRLRQRTREREERGVEGTSAP